MSIATQREIRHDNARAFDAAFDEIADARDDDIMGAIERAHAIIRRSHLRDNAPNVIAQITFAMFRDDEFGGEM